MITYKTFRNRPMNRFHRHCREWYSYNNPNAGENRILNDEMKNYGFSFKKMGTIKNTLNFCNAAVFYDYKNV